MGPERLDYPSFEPKIDSAQKNQRRNLRKPFKGAKGVLAAAAVTLSGVIAATAAQAENSQNYSEPQFSGDHPTRLLTDNDLNPSELLLNYPEPGSDLGSASTETNLWPDTDGDGCADVEESLPTASRIGGLRDPANPLDFFDLNGDKRVNIIDIQMVAYRFGVVKGQPLYNPKFDRSVIGPNNWNLGPGDGVISSVDLGAVFSQNQHQCGPLLYFLENPERFKSQGPPEPPDPNPSLFDPAEPQTPPYPESHDALEPLLAKIAKSTLNAQSQPFIATDAELSPELQQTLNNYFENLNTNQANQLTATGGLPIVCGMQTGDRRVDLPRINYLWGSGFRCFGLPGEELDYAVIHVFLQYWDWGDEVWRNERFLNERTWYGENEGLIWGAEWIPPYYGINCKRIRAHILLEEDDDPQHYWQYSAGKCY